MTTIDVSSHLDRCHRAMAVSRDGFWERDLASGEVWLSPSFNAMFGFGEGEIDADRRRAQARMHPDDLPRFNQLYAIALARDEAFDYELRFLDAAGHWRWVRGRAQVWRDADGQPEYLTGAVIDVHREKIALMALEEQSRRLEAQVSERTEGLAAALTLAEERRLEAERANAAKTRFLAHISHEIRTPLNGVLGLNELALRGAHSVDQRRYLETARASGQTLLQVITDVLDLSRIESGRHELRPKAFDLAESLSSTLRALMPLVGGRPVLLLFDYEGDAGWVRGDEGAIRQIVTNLLGNAIKFTAEGQVALSADTRVLADGRAALAIRVSDTGPGIPAERQGQVFEAFVQADERHAQAGAGLGLAIAQGLARALGGSLSLYCPPEGGTVFTLTLTLPVALPGDAPADSNLMGYPGLVPDEQPPDAATDAAPGLAWLVYPQRAQGTWTARRLARLGWRVAVMAGVDAALAQARAGDRPDLVLLAEPALLPGTDLQPLRALLPQATLRLLIRPDWHDPVLETQALALHITPLVAPLTPAQLRRVTEVDDAQAPHNLRGTAGSLRPGAEVLLVEDNPVNQLVGQEFLKALGLTVRVVCDGSEALSACTERTPDLVLMDLQMPGMDGLTATRQLRAMARDGQWAGAPIVALTAHASPGDRAACRAAGMSGMLTKPLSLDMLRQQLPRWLS